MEITLEEFQTEVKMVRESGRRLRYSEEMKRFAVSYAEQKMSEGVTRSRCVTDLGIAEGTFSKWMEGSPSGGFKRVKTIEDAGSKQVVTMITPDGFRFEGLSIKAAGVLFRSLR
ncbi:MAG: hypothetical protein GY847_17630 [Proteobacteria bacterium]|nr:hypothetical protein [Pseudomonadota bacterium]